MARKNLQTPDGKHVKFSDGDTYNEPPNFNAPDNAATCSQWFGRIMENPGDSGFGAAYIDRDEYD